MYRRPLLRRWVLGLLAMPLAAGLLAAEPTKPYDETADAPAQVQQALTAAQKAHKPVLLVFGANWCPDCRALDTALHQGRNADLIQREFEVVKIDVGNFDRNLDLAKQYGNPIKKGIPAAVIVSPSNQVLYATKAGELANARRMGEGDVYKFFDDAVKQARAQ
jgi:protein disulfide-isomerase